MSAWSQSLLGFHEAQCTVAGPGFTVGQVYPVRDTAGGPRLVCNSGRLRASSQTAQFLGRTPRLATRFQSGRGGCCGLGEVTTVESLFLNFTWPQGRAVLDPIGAPNRFRPEEGLELFPGVRLYRANECNWHQFRAAMVERRITPLTGRKPMGSLVTYPGPGRLAVLRHLTSTAEATTQAFDRPTYLVAAAHQSHVLGSLLGQDVWEPRATWVNSNTGHRLWLFTRPQSTPISTGTPV